MDFAVILPFNGSLLLMEECVRVRLSRFELVHLRSGA